MSAPNLTTLARVKAWLGLSTDNDDELLSTLVSAASRFFYRYISLPTVAVASYTERRDGYGNYWLSPYNWPLISVESIQYGGYSITQEAQGNPPSQGYTIKSPEYGPSRLTIHGYPCLPRGKDQVVINYTAGFREVDEPHVIPATPGPYVVNTDLLWAGALVVKTSLGVEMTQVSGTPGAGEYSVSATGQYTFNAAQQGSEVLITYSYVPNDLSQAVTELVGATYKSKEQIGIRSKSLGGQETISYFQNAITPHIELLAQPFRRVTPK